MIVLLGLRGSGKSTIASLIAAALPATPRAIDLDDLTPSCATPPAASAGDLLRERGEPAFRTAEYAALASVLASNERPFPVLALGGGTPTAPGATDLLREARNSRRAVLMYLRASPETLRRRLAAADNANRPSLTGAGTLEEIEAVFNARDARYRELASHTIEVDALSPDQVVDRVLASL